MIAPLENSPKKSPNSVKSFLARFAREEDGVLLVFSVYIFLIILMIGGIGVDVMRHERVRSLLQNTQDRAVLAAADLDQTQDPAVVVTDYFTKAGLAQYLTSISVDEGLGYRTVSATANAEVNTLFMHMTGVDSLNAGSISTAEERIDGVEISLILDVSGSMNSNSKLTNLKTAARDFIDEMVENTEDGKLSISIIPYATQVSMPSEFISNFNTTNDHNYSHCINFESDDFHDPGMSLIDQYQQTMHFDPWNSNDGRDDDPMNLVSRPVCEAMSSREMMILQDDASTLKSFISNLSARGNTSIDIGMKWGTALLDPSLEPVVDDLIAGGHVDAKFDALPRSYEAGDSLKVIVLMTDGKNTSQYYIEDDYRLGASDIWWNADEEKYSVQKATYDPYTGTTDYEYFWPHNSTWNDHAYGNGGAITYCGWYRWNGSCGGWYTIPPEPGEAVALDYPELWAYTTLKKNVKANYEPWMYNSQAWDDWYYDVRSYVGTSTKDARTKDICDAVKAQQVIVFTIGFEAPASGEAVLSDCASSPSHFFDVDGLAINDAFASIASSIRKLRLTQ